MGPEWIVLFVLLAIPAFLALIPASIAGNKGYSKGGFWLFGLLLFLPALIVAIVISPKAGAVPQTAAASSTPTAITWTHSGTRYLLGFTIQNPYYGIWDRQAPGPAMGKYPYNEHGKAEALAKYQELEPHFQAVAQGGLPPSPPISPTPPDSEAWSADTS